MKFTKHIHVLHLLSTIPASGVTAEETAAAWDHLYTYIHAHWPRPMSAATGDRINWNTRWQPEQDQEMIDCEQMLKMKPDELQAKLATLPPFFTEMVFPVAVARYLLRDLKLNVSPSQLSTFNEFHLRYGAMIICGACGR